MDQSAPPRLMYRKKPPAGGGREDCWSEGATEALVEAWGERYIQLKRGNLRQKDWQEVADAVNEHQDALGRPRRTDVQCKNRIDTLKKKYKIEKARRGPSEWSFLSRLDELIGPSSATGTPGSGGTTLKKHNMPKSEPPVPLRSSLTLKLKNRAGSTPKPVGIGFLGGSSIRPRAKLSSGSSESSHGETGYGDDDDNDEDILKEDEDEEAEEEDDRGRLRFHGVSIPKKRRWNGSMDGVSGGRPSGSGGSKCGDDMFGELAKVILKFGDIYEKIESSKQQQLMEMERKRMEFTRKLELQRMQMFMDTQLKLQNIKRPKHYSNEGDHF